MRPQKKPVNFLEEFVRIQEYLATATPVSDPKLKAAKAAYNAIISTIYGPDKRTIIRARIAAPCVSDHIKQVQFK